MKKKNYRKLNKKVNYDKNKIKLKQIEKLIIISLLFFIFVYIINSNLILTKIEIFPKFYPKEKRVGVVNLQNYQNVGNILVKFAMLKKLQEFGLNVTIIAPKLSKEYAITFVDRTISSNLVLINKNFSELNEKDFDYLIVNSDQTWGFYFSKYFYDFALLKFAQNWKTKKFIYAASLGQGEWIYRKSDEGLFKNLLQNFTGISFREKRTINLLEEHLGLKSVLVIDPTLLIDKNYYLKEIISYKSDINISEKYIFVYQLANNIALEKTIKDASEKLNLRVYKHDLKRKHFIENFIFGINNSQCVITDSYHGTLLSIIFNKPFLTFNDKTRGKARFDSLKEVIQIDNRIILPSKFNNININLLSEPLNLNLTSINLLKSFSIHYLKQNLDLL